MGVLNVTPDSFSDGGRWFDARRRGRARAPLLDDGADIARRRRGVDPSRRRPGRPPTRSARGCVPVVAALAAEGVAVSRRHDARRGRAAARSRPARRSSTTCPAASPTPRCCASSPRPGSTTSRCTGARHADRWTTLDALRRRGRRGPRRTRAPGSTPASRRGRAPSRSCSTRDSASRRPAGQLAAARAPRRAHGPRPAGARRGLPQAVPRHAPGGPDGRPRPARDAATAAVTALAADAGAWCVRVHEVGGSADAVRVAAAGGSPVGTTSGRHGGTQTPQTPVAGGESDQIRLVGISAVGHHGVFEHERREGQSFGADVVLISTPGALRRPTTLRAPSTTACSLSRSPACWREPVDLIETVAERIAATVLAHAQVVAVDVEVHKPQAPLSVPFDDVAVSIRRDRGEFRRRSRWTRRTASPRNRADRAGRARTTGDRGAPGRRGRSGPVADEPAACGRTDLGAVPSGRGPGRLHRRPGPEHDPAPVGRRRARRDPGRSRRMSSSRSGPTSARLRTRSARRSRLSRRSAGSRWSGCRRSRDRRRSGGRTSRTTSTLSCSRGRRSRLGAAAGHAGDRGGPDRERAERWGPRTLDIDLIVYGSILAVADDLELPHPGPMSAPSCSSRGRRSPRTPCCRPRGRPGRRPGGHGAGPQRYQVARSRLVGPVGGDGSDRTPGVRLVLLAGAVAVLSAFLLFGLDARGGSSRRRPCSPRS